LAQPLPQAALPRLDEVARNPAALDDLISLGMAHGHVAAATAAAELLANVGTPAVLARFGARPCALVQALDHGDCRLRLAAAETVLRIRGTLPAPGLSRLVPTLALLAGTSGERRALVVHRRSLAGQQLAGLLAEAGYRVDVARTGREGFQLASGSPDYELALIDAAVARPSLHDLLGQLRKDPATATLPLVIVAPVDALDRLRHLTAQVPGCEAVPMPTTPAAARLMAQRQLARAGRSFAPHEERQQQAERAWQRLAELALGPTSADETAAIERAAVRCLVVPRQAAAAAVVLGRLGTPRSQQALAQLAASQASGIDLRHTAALAFAGSLQRRGLQLTTGEIRLLYERYHASAAGDPQGAPVLSSLLDAMEGRAAE
jgi:DNA-binding response OmpR family regulator